MSGRGRFLLRPPQLVLVFAALSCNVRDTSGDHRGALDLPKRGRWEARASEAITVRTYVMRLPPTTSTLTAQRPRALEPRQRQRGPLLWTNPVRTLTAERPRVPSSSSSPPPYRRSRRCMLGLQRRCSGRVRARLGRASRLRCSFDDVLMYCGLDGPLALWTHIGRRG